MNVNALPEILEIKHALGGRRREFHCRVLEQRGAASVVVLYVLDAPWQVSDLCLPAGTVTFGHFWSDRPYNVYHWMAPDGRTLGHYVNLATETRIAPGRLEWRDLTVDILLRPGAAPEVLDEAELPADLDPGLGHEIARAKNQVLASHEPLVAGLETEADRLWPRVAGGGRS